MFTKARVVIAGVWLFCIIQIPYTSHVDHVTTKAQIITIIVILYNNKKHIFSNKSQFNVYPQPTHAGRVLPYILPMSIMLKLVPIGWNQFCVVGRIGCPTGTARLVR